MNYSEGAFSQKSLHALAEEMTTIGVECERLANTPFVRSTTWIYAHEHPVQTVFVGGKSMGTKVVSLEVNVFEGGLDDHAKNQLIERLTSAIRNHGGIKPDTRVPVYIVIREVAPSNWGVFGDRITLESLRTPPADAKPV
jgi:phenylpyruvate tautomerase PptA (4-oxalocrotonate tautomerase family)